jgi:hypothetical protein
MIDHPMFACLGKIYQCHILHYKESYYVIGYDFQINILYVSFDRFIQQKLGGPSVSEYEKLQAEMSNLQIKYDELLAEHQETCKEVCYITLEFALICTIFN